MIGLFKRFVERPAPMVAGYAGALEGTYDFRGNRLVGQVVAELRESRRAIEIEVRRGGRLVASFPATAIGDGRIQAFEVPIEGLLTGADLIRETVELRAANRQGYSGPLSLQGTTRLELIREHLGIPVETVFDLDLTRGGNAAGFLGKGWSGPEDRYTWTEGDESYVIFPTPAKRGRHLLRMRYGTFITDILRRQALEISLNGEEFAAFYEDELGAQFREFSFDGALFGNAAKSELRLYHPYAGRPSEQSGSRDNRRLAFSFSRLTLVRVLKAET